METHVTPPPPPPPVVYTCPYCDETFATELERAYHIARYHPLPEPPVPPEPEPEPPPADGKVLARVNYYIGLVPAAGFLAAAVLFDLVRGSGRKKKD